MQAQLTNWGNSLGMRIPKALATRLGFTAGAHVEVAAEGDSLVISAARPRYRIEDLGADLSNAVLRDAFDWGPDKGRWVFAHERHRHGTAKQRARVIADLCRSDLWLQD